MPDGPARDGREAPTTLTAPLLVLFAIVSVQCGAAATTELFDDVGPGGAVLLRLVFAALVLVALWRPFPIRGDRRALALVALFGVALAAMNLSFYEALDRIPLGIAVTLEFVGPLGVALAASRRRLDLVWVALAAAGVVLVSGPSGDADLTGIGFALAAGAFWAAYIVLSSRVGQAFEGGAGLALAMTVAAALMLGPGIAIGGANLLEPEVVAIGFAVAVLSSAIPYSLELEALRRLPVGVFGVLMSLEPAVAAAVGAVALSQGLSAAEVAGIAAVTAASAGVLRRSGTDPTA
jgi:inner membrane transporter RhtA